MSQFNKKNKFLDEMSTLNADSNAESKEDPGKTNENCVFSADYDGCFSIMICMLVARIIKVCCSDKENYLEEIQEPFRELIKTLDSRYKEVDLVCGSARQCYHSNQRNRDIQSRHYPGVDYLKMGILEGCVFTDLENFMTHMQISKDTKAQWNLWKLLYADGEDDAGVSWKNADRKVGYIDESKRDLIKYQILRGIKKHGPAYDFVFIDDREDILTHLKNMLESKPDWLPSTVNVKLYRYDWYDIATESSTDGFKLFFQNKI